MHSYGLTYSLFLNVHALRYYQPTLVLLIISLNTLAIMASQNSDITLYTTQTPNGIKISITLEELGYV